MSHDETLLCFAFIVQGGGPVIREKERGACGSRYNDD
jgi:hypothetical protein